MVRCAHGAVCASVHTTADAELTAAPKLATEEQRVRVHISSERAVMKRIIVFTLSVGVQNDRLQSCTTRLSQSSLACLYHNCND